MISKWRKRLGVGSVGLMCDSIKVTDLAFSMFTYFYWEEKVSILKMKQQQHDINLRRTRIFFPSPPQINIMLLLFHL